MFPVKNILFLSLKASLYKVFNQFIDFYLFQCIFSQYHKRCREIKCMFLLKIGRKTSKGIARTQMYHNGINDILYMRFV